MFCGTGLPHHFPVFFIDKRPYIIIHTLLQCYFASKCRLQAPGIPVVHFQRTAIARFQIKETYQIKINTQCMDQVHLPLLVFFLFLFLLQFLCGAVQKKTLVEKFPVLL